MTSSSATLVALADEHTLFRQLLAGIINTTPTFKVLISTDNGIELLALLETAEELPGLCVLDVRTAGLNGYETLHLLKKRWPNLKVLVLSNYTAAFCISNMIANGANGFVSKNSTIEDLRYALTMVSDEGFYFHEDVSQRQLSQYHLSAPVVLTDREKEYLRLCCSDKTNQQIAKEMFISSRTVEHYCDSLYVKLGVRNRMGLMLHALQTGLVCL